MSATLVKLRQGSRSIDKNIYQLWKRNFCPQNNIKKLLKRILLLQVAKEILCCIDNLIVFENGKKMHLEAENMS